MSQNYQCSTKRTVRSSGPHGAALLFLESLVEDETVTVTMKSMEPFENFDLEATVTRHGGKTTIDVQEMKKDGQPPPQRTPGMVQNEVPS